MKPDDWDEDTLPKYFPYERVVYPSSMPTDAPPTERDLEQPTEVPEAPVTLPAPPFIPKDKDRGKLPLNLREWRPG